MTAKRIFGIAYHVLEVAVLLFFTVIILLVRFSGDVYDRADYLDQWEMGLIGASFLFFVSIPIILIYLVSFFRSLPFRSVWQKIILCGHGFNIALWLVLYFLLPKATPCTIAEMEEHYLSHQAEIHDLVAYTKNCLNDSSSIDYEIREDEIKKLMVDCFDQWDYHVMNEPGERDSILMIVGITRAEFDTINAKMKKAGIIGFEINRKGYNRQSRLKYRTYGATDYQYTINHDPSQQYDPHGAPFDTLHSIAYNDTIYFQSLGNMVWRDFPDREQYIQNKKSAQ